MNKDPRKPAVLDYDNYREFLRDSFEYCKRTEPGFTYRVFSARAGLTSPSALKEVIDAKIGISRSSLPKYIKGFGLHKKDAEFFAMLVRFNQAKAEQEQNDWYLKMMEVRRKKNATTLNAAQFEYCNKWYYSVIREMVGMEGFRPDPAWIASVIRPSITPTKAKKALELLVELGLVHREADGRLVQASAHIDIEPEINRLATRNLNRSMIARAGDAIGDVEPDEREISHVTVGMSRERYGEIQRRIRAFKADMLELIARDEAAKDMVCQMNIQLFPFTQERVGKDGPEET